jgi:hypothetical protein
MNLSVPATPEEIEKIKKNDDLIFKKKLPKNKK